jgi:tRNA 2-thiocytidine biosynthesis protein TtcA
MNLQTLLDQPLSIRIRKKIVQALNDFGMISNGDRILVCVSGGKDSSILLALLKEIQRRSQFQFEIQAAILDQKQPGFKVEEFKNWVEVDVGVPLHILERDTYSIVKEKIQSGTYCSLCSRLRRAILYDFAYEKGFNKMALGHHKDDLVETLLLNMFYTGNISSMPPKLKSDDGRNLVIRPLAYVDEKDLIELQKQWAFPLIPCNLCGSQEGLKRKKIKNLLNELESDIPAIKESLLTSMSQVKPSQLLDKNLWDFESFQE